MRALPGSVPDGLDRRSRSIRGSSSPAVRDAVYEATPADPRGGLGPRQRATAPPARRDLIGGWISEDTIWACTTCGFCTSACPVFIVPAVDKIVEMRRYLVLDKAEFPKEMQTAFRGMETNGNPVGHLGVVARRLGRGPARRDDGGGGGTATIDVLFWVGCAGSYEDRAKKVSRALVEMLDAAGVSFAILGNRGDLQRRLGPADGQRVPLPDRSRSRTSRR